MKSKSNDLPEYLDKHLDELLQEKKDGGYSSGIGYERELVGNLGNKKWFVIRSEEGEKMIVRSGEYGKLDLPPEFSDFIERSARESGSSESEVVKLGLTLLKLARKIKDDGLNLAVAEKNGTIISKIEL